MKKIILGYVVILGVLVSTSLQTEASDIKISQTNLLEYQNSTVPGYVPRSDLQRESDFKSFDLEGLEDPNDPNSIVPNGNPVNQNDTSNASDPYVPLEVDDSGTASQTQTPVAEDPITGENGTILRLGFWGTLFLIVIVLIIGAIIGFLLFKRYIVLRHNLKNNKDTIIDEVSNDRISNNSTRQF